MFDGDMLRLLLTAKLSEFAFAGKGNAVRRAYRTVTIGALRLA